MAKAVRVYEWGKPDVLRIEERDLGAPSAGEARIKVEAIGLNRSEALFRAGRYPVRSELPTLIGYEACGIVEAVGRGVVGCRVGDRVCVVPMFQLGTYGVWAEQAIVPAYCLRPAPAFLRPTEAASIWMAYMTAYAIIEVANVGVGDGVIIRAASSSVGIAAIQLANWTGAISIAATRTSAKAEELKVQGAAHVIVTEERNLVQQVLRITGGKGAKLAFDPVGGPYVETLATALSERGILIIYGNLSEEETPWPHWTAALRGLSLRGWLASEIWKHPHRYQRASDLILKGLELGRLRPVIARTFPFSEIVEANRFLESNEQIGKVVVTM